MNGIGVVRKCGQELIHETSVDRSMGEKESAEFSFGMSVNGRYGGEELRNLLFFFTVSFVASFLLDVLYGVRDKSELCVQVFFRR